MNKTDTTAEHWRLQLIAAACALTKLLAAEQPLKLPDRHRWPSAQLAG